LNFEESAWTLELGKSYMSNLLLTPIEYLKGVGPNGELLRKELGIIKDLINLYPNRYIDRTRYYKINELQNNVAEVQIIGKISISKPSNLPKAGNDS
jgi:RecG-like helicase